MPENDWVRVTDKDTGHRLSVRQSAVAHGNYNVLKSPAIDPVTGDVLPPEFNTTSGQSADPKKEITHG
ncbi:hypothetical protein [Nocardioides kribbensis]|uniref:Uncharacterized protein n=1 Tax=Nocardioides kribbensis TaxID=305517 RepID=A0ABV1NYY6_9ACTN